MSLFFMHEPDQLATMSDAQAEHIRNSGGQRLYDDGGTDEGGDETIRSPRHPNPQPRTDPVPDLDWNDIEF